MLSNSKEMLEDIRRMEVEKRRQVCFEEHRCHYCKRAVGVPPSHVAQNCAFKPNKTKSDYLDIFPEVQPRKGIPDSAIVEGIPQRKEICINVVNNRLKKLFFVRELCVDAMVDSGAMGTGFIDRKYVEKEGLKTSELDSSIRVSSVDGTSCGTGVITKSVCLHIVFKDFEDDVELLVIDCPNSPVIFGLDWLKFYNPMVNWKG